MRAAFLGRLPVPATVRARRRRWAGVERGRDGLDRFVRYTGAFEALRALGCEATGLCRVRLEGPVPAVPDPPMILYRAGAARHAVILDHDSLYARAAVDLLRGRVPDVWPAEPGLARDAASRAWTLNEFKRDADAERYIVVSEYTAYWRLRAQGPRDMGSYACRKWYESHARDRPLTLDEAVEVLRGVPCRAYAVRVKDAAKFSVLAAIGYTKRTTGLWRYVVAWARRVVLETVRWLEEEEGLAVRRVYVDSYELQERPGRWPPMWRRYPVKLEAEGDAVTVLPPLYRVGDRRGIWLVWMEDGVPPEIPVARGEATVYYMPAEEEWYRRAYAAMDGALRPAATWDRIVETAARYRVRVEWRGGWLVRDLAPGRPRPWREPVNDKTPGWHGL